MEKIREIYKLFHPTEKKKGISGVETSNKELTQMAKKRGIRLPRKGL